MTDAAQDSGSGESVFTVIVAAAANLGIAIAKAVAGVISGSSAMLSEAAHSVADTVTELLLLTALKRSEKPADEDHPLGYGPERYRTLAQCSTLQGGGEGHPVHGGPEDRSGMAKIALPDDGVVRPTAGRAGSQACGGHVRPTFTGRRRPVKQEPTVVLRSSTDRNHLPSGR
jgi:hypothetical protein